MIEKCCMNCKHYRDKAVTAYSGTCEAPLPRSLMVSEKYAMAPEATGCECWTAKLEEVK